MLIDLEIATCCRFHPLQPAPEKFLQAWSIKVMAMLTSPGTGHSEIAYFSWVAPWQHAFTHGLMGCSASR